MRYMAKRLTRSDLTFFEHQYRTFNAGNQKAINLDASVFIHRLFPAAPARAAGHSIVIPVTLSIYGPDGRAVHELPRVITSKGDRQKNWRLNGETVKDPDGGRDLNRYDALTDGDIAILGFDGADVPDTVDLYLLRQDSPVDAPSWRVLDGILAKRSIVELSGPDLDSLIVGAPKGHPVTDLLDSVSEEITREAALGSSVARSLLARRGFRRTAEQLALARSRAEAIGRNGELLVIGHLRARELAGHIDGLVWESDANAVNAWDISYRNKASIDLRAEVKTTVGPHEKAFHISQSEIVTAAAPTGPEVQIWRVSELDDDGGILRRSKDLPKLARELVVACQNHPEGIVVDSWSIDPRRLEWDDPIHIRFDEDPE